METQNKKICSCGKECYVKNLCKNCYRQLPHIKLQRKKENKKYHSKPEVKEKAKNIILSLEEKKIKQTQRNNRRNIRYRKDVLFNLKCKMRTRLRNFLKRKNFYKNDSTTKIIGCSPQELKDHIQKQFTFDMNWDLVLSGDIHIDHIISLNSAKTEENLKKLFHYSNLQPLWAEDNMSKNANII